jgi:hypothetical protein
MYERRDYLQMNIAAEDDWAKGQLCEPMQ